MADRVANGVMRQQSHVFNNDMNWIFSPRLGFAYDPFANNKWVVRGGIGLFHDLFTLGNAENGLKGNPPGFVVPTFYNNGSTACAHLQLRNPEPLSVRIPISRVRRPAPRREGRHPRIADQRGRNGCESVLAQYR